jgi:cell division protease FtsH
MFGQTTKKKRLSDIALKRIAIHEIGHLLMGMNSKYVEKPEKVSIDTTNTATLGYTMFEASDLDEGLYLREYLEDKLKLLLGGRVAEEVIYGMSVSSGALSDLEGAFNMAKSMIMQYGMGDKIIYPYFSEQYKKEIDDEIHILINAAYKDTKKILENNKLLLIRLADRLVEKKVMSFKEITDFVINFQLVNNLIKIDKN